MQPSTRPQTILQLIMSRSVTLDGSGKGSVVFRNGGQSTWHVKLMNTTTTGVLQPKCTVFRGEAKPRNQIDVTRTGNTDTSSTDLLFRVGEFLTVTWEGGTVGAIATFSVEGDDIVQGRRGY